MFKHILLVAIILFVTVSAEWTTIDCEDKSVKKAINAAQREIQSTLDPTVKYHTQKALSCKVQEFKDKKMYGLSIYGSDTKQAHYDHVCEVELSEFGDYTVKHLQMIGKKEVGEFKRYPWQGMVF